MYVLKTLETTKWAIKNGQSALNETNKEISTQLILDLNELEKANAILKEISTHENRGRVLKKVLR